MITQLIIPLRILQSKLPIPSLFELVVSATDSAETSAGVEIDAAASTTTGGSVGVGAAAKSGAATAVTGSVGAVGATGSAGSSEGAGEGFEFRFVSLFISNQYTRVGDCKQASGASATLPKAANCLYYTQ